MIKQLFKIFLVLLFFPWSLGFMLIARAFNNDLLELLASGIKWAVIITIIIYIGG